MGFMLNEEGRGGIRDVKIMNRRNTAPVQCHSSVGKYILLYWR